MTAMLLRFKASNVDAHACPITCPLPQFTGCLKDDVTTRRWLAQLLVNVGHLQDAAALGTDVVGPTPPV